MNARGMVVAAVTGLLVSSCYDMRPSDGAGQAPFTPPRVVAAGDVALPAGYRIEAVAQDLTFPTAVAFDGQGRPHVVEAGYSYGEVWTTPRLLRIEPDGRHVTVAAGGDNGPWTGAVWHNGAFYVAEGGARSGGALLRIGTDGRMVAIVRDLPSMGDHHTNGPAIGPDGWLYFGIGTATNAAVVGTDNAEMGWLKRRPAFHDFPCADVTLAGVNHPAANPLGGGQASTGAYVPFGTATQAGQRVAGRLPCTGAILRVRPSGGEGELVAWGLRNPFGLAFAPDGRLFATDNSYDERGQRQVFGAGDLLWEIRPGGWYGWPDYHGTYPLWEGDRYAPPGRPAPSRLLATHPGKPPRPAAVFAVHASADGFDFARDSAFGHVGEAFVALFGDQAPNTGKVMAAVGAKVVRVDPATGVIQEFAVNKGPIGGPASKLGSGGLERPVAARFDPSGRALYVVDFGVFTMDGTTMIPRPGTGVLWRISRDGG